MVETHAEVLLKEAQVLGPGREVGSTAWFHSGPGRL